MLSFIRGVVVIVSLHGNRTVTKTLAPFHLELNVLLLPQGLRPLLPAVHPSLLLSFKAQTFLSQVSQIPSLLSSTPKHTPSSISNLTLSHRPQSSLRKVPPRATSQGVKPALLAHRGISKQMKARTSRRHTSKCIKVGKRMVAHGTENFRVRI